jgi:uncharacterized tellurite resistance protein B-like protein
MSKDICMGCKAKKKLTAFNYAGFKVNADSFHAYPERINKGKLKGSQETHFICVDCVNKLTITCKAHGKIEGKFSMGVPPSCKLCPEEKIETDKEAIRQKYWQNTYPELVDNLRLKLIYLRGALAYQLMKADGDVSQSELDIIGELAKWTCDSDSEGDIFYKGALDVKKKSLKLNVLLDLCHQLKHKKHNINTVKFLFKISASDDSLDRAEYNFIRKISLIFKLNIPKFEDLAETLNVQTGNAQKDRIVKTTGDVLVTVGKGALIVGGVLIGILSTILENSNTSQTTQRGSRTKAKGANRAKGKFIVPGSRQHCCTCEFWIGERKLENKLSTRAISYIDPKIVGECINKDSDYKYSKNRNLHAKCSKWVKWCALN